VKDLILSEQM